MTISFLHAADIHLDSPLRGLERYENAPWTGFEGRRNALSRMIDLAIEKCVDFVLIAGDLYDGDWRDYNTGLFLVKELSRLRDNKIRVVLIQGNHDAANKMTRALPLPENVRLLTHERPETVVWDDLGVAIHGQSFARAAVTENLAAAYPAAVAGCVNIGLLHTCLAGRKAMSRTRLARSKTSGCAVMITGRSGISTHARFCAATRWSRSPAMSRAVMLARPERRVV